jgi:hypothetical protein
MIYTLTNNIFSITKTVVAVTQKIFSNVETMVAVSKKMFSDTSTIRGFNFLRQVGPNIPGVMRRALNF